MFEYPIVSWLPKVDGAAFAEVLNALGAEGSEAVGTAPRGASAPMPGVGARVVPEVVVLLKRPMA